jgi:hypothetical protein
MINDLKRLLSMAYKLSLARALYFIDSININWAGMGRDLTYTP